MGKVTITISKETKRKLASFGSKGESYEKILQRIYDIVVKNK